MSAMISLASLHSGPHIPIRIGVVARRSAASLLIPGEAAHQNEMMSPTVTNDAARHYEMMPPTVTR